MRAEAVQIRVDGQTVRGNLYMPDGKTRPVAVLFLHGWTGQPNEVAAKWLAQHGYTVLTIQMRGHGDSDGDIQTVSRQDSLDDAVAAYDFLAGRVSAGTGIVAVGNSYGGYIGALLTGERPVTALSLRVPAAYPDRGFTEWQMGQGGENIEVMQWRQMAHDWQENRGFAAVHTFAGPVQIMEAEHDDVIPHQTVENYKAAVYDPDQLEYLFLSGWPHSIGPDPKRNRQFRDLLLAWLEKVPATVPA